MLLILNVQKSKNNINNNLTYVTGSLNIFAPTSVHSHLFNQDKYEEVFTFNLIVNRH
jgi:hypothetical protein